MPVKRLDDAKTRLAGLPSKRRAELALAFAADTVAAAAGCPLIRRVIVVTDDALAGAVLAGRGAHVVPDRPDAGLNAALRHG
ncbi:MAG: 2-phospho-L-lactate guanylyltransferase, partial [Carbonactinosporaceae bacterium]